MQYAQALTQGDMQASVVCACQPYINTANGKSQRRAVRLGSALLRGAKLAR